jgi:CheY-like chemotaxis protein
MKPLSSTSARHRPLIYVVDDESMILSLIDAMLVKERYNVRLFRDPETALQSFLEAEERPRLLVTDYAMGAMSGAELIARCRAAAPALPTLLMSGTMPEEFARQLDTPPDRFLNKPFEAATFLQAVRELLKN